MTPFAKKTGLPTSLPLGFSANSRPVDAFWRLSTTRADANPFNHVGQVALTRENDKSITFNDFHRDMFDQQVKKAGMRAVFTESAWDMNWCDPCAADPLSHEELRSLGVFRLTETPPDLVPGRGPRAITPPMGGARDVFVTRMHARSDAGHFPETLALSETTDPAGWELTDSRQKMNPRTADAGNDVKWWQKRWTC